MNNNKIKCVVWDLDNTVFDGTLLENGEVKLRKGIKHIIDTIDKRGILQSIASKNNFEIAWNKLKDLGIEKYFIYPQINWNSKSSSIHKIAKSINIGIETVAFIDDEQYELDEVKFSIPEILLINTANISGLLDLPQMNPNFITIDSKNRRQMYINDIERNKAEENFIGPKVEFLKSLNMELTISRAKESDLQRIEELTNRTHQLNSTGYTYSYDELAKMCKEDKYMLLVVGLKDKFGDYGKIGFTLIECDENNRNIKLLLMSCRVISRGVGSVLLNYVIAKANEEKIHLYAHFKHTKSNNMMYITLKFAGFKEISDKENVVILENDFKHIQKIPHYIKLNIEE